MPDDLKTAKKVVGAKQLRRALNEGRVLKAYFAEDADPLLTQPLEALCKEAKVAVFHVPTMKELGGSCGIKVGAACAAIVH